MKGTLYCDKEECEGSIIYLAANTSNIVHCSGDKSCNGAEIYCGIPDTFPDGYNINDFIGNIQECLFYMENKAALDPTLVI